jgi:hypothetical protein
MKKLVLTFLVIAAGCAAFARERSPKPEAAQLTIKATIDKIRALLLADFVAQGFTVDSEVAGTQLQMSKPARETDIVSPGRFLHDQMIGQGVGGHNRNCRRTHRVIFLPDGESTAVTMQWESSCEVQAGFGARSTDRHWTETDKKKIRWMQDELESIKQRAETPNASAKKQASSASPTAEAKPVLEAQHVTGECIQTSTGACQK